MNKKILYLFALLNMFSGCIGPKNTTISTSTDSLSVVYKLDSINRVVVQTVDTTSSKHIVTTITEVLLDDSIGASIATNNRFSIDSDLARTILNNTIGKVKKIKKTKIDEYSEKLGKSINNESNTDVSIKSTSTKSSKKNKCKKTGCS